MQVYVTCPHREYKRAASGRPAVNKSPYLAGSNGKPFLCSADLDSPEPTAAADEGLEDLQAWETASDEALWNFESSVDE